MGTIVKNPETQHKRSDGIEHIFVPVNAGIRNTLFKGAKMAELKVMIIISNIFGWSFVGLGITPILGISQYLHLNSVQSNIVFALATLFMVHKLYFSIRKNIQELQNRDMALKERKHKLNQKIKDESE